MEEGHDRSGEDEFKRQERAGPPDDGDGAGESRHEEEEPLDPDQIEIIGDLGNEFDDPEGWMSERPTYWADRADVPMHTREALIWRRIHELLGMLRSMAATQTPPWPTDRIDDATWRGLADPALGLSPDASREGGE